MDATLFDKFFTRGKESGLQVIRRDRAIVHRWRSTRWLVKPSYGSIAAFDVTCTQLDGRRVPTNFSERNNGEDVSADCSTRMPSEGRTRSGSRSREESGAALSRAGGSASETRGARIGDHDPRSANGPFETQAVPLVHDDADSCLDTLVRVSTAASASQRFWPPHERGSPSGAARFLYERRGKSKGSHLSHLPFGRERAAGTLYIETPR